MKGNTIYLSLGSNLGDRELNISVARDLIWKHLGLPGLCSRIFESSPWGYKSMNIFYNCVLSLETLYKPLPLMEEILYIEKALGRERKGEGYTDRIIDIDLLLYADLILDLPLLKIPHPAMPERRFVLEPLSEIAPDLVHPVSGLTIKKMLHQCEDPGQVLPV